MKALKWIVATLAMLALAIPAAAQDKPVTARTFAGTFYYHIVSGRDKGQNLGDVVYAYGLDTTAQGGRWYLGVEMADQEQPGGQGGVGPTLIWVDDVKWWTHNGEPIMSIIAQVAYLDAARFDADSESFEWGPFAGLGTVFHPSADTKVIIGMKFTPSRGDYVLVMDPETGEVDRVWTQSRFLDNVGLGVGVFIANPEKKIAKVIKGAADALAGLFD